MAGRLRQAPAQLGQRLLVAALPGQAARQRGVQDGDGGSVGAVQVAAGHRLRLFVAGQPAQHGGQVPQGVHLQPRHRRAVGDPGQLAQDGERLGLRLRVPPQPGQGHHAVTAGDQPQHLRVEADRLQLRDQRVQFVQRLGRPAVHDGRSRGEHPCLPVRRTPAPGASREGGQGPRLGLDLLVPALPGHGPQPGEGLFPLAVPCRSYGRHGR